MSRINCVAAKSAVFVFIFAAMDAIATDYTWTGAGDGVTWSSADNWDGGNKFVSSTSNRLIFQNPVQDAVISVPNNISVNSIKFAAGCKSMTLTGEAGRTITNVYKSETLTDATTESGASIFVETTEPIKIDVIQCMTGGRSVGLAQGAHLEILKPIVDNSQKLGRVYFRTLGESVNSYLKIDYDPTSASYALDPVEGNFLYQFLGGTNEISAAICATSQASPKPVICGSSAVLKLNAGTYPRQITGGYHCVVKTEGAVTFSKGVSVSSSSCTLNFGGATTVSGGIRYTYNGADSPSHTLKFGGDTTINGDMTVTKSGGSYMLDLAAGVRVDFYGQVKLTGASLGQRIPTTSAIHYHDLMKCTSLCDDPNGEPASGHRGGTIHFYEPIQVDSNFYLRGYNVVCEAANVLPSGRYICWRYEAQANCGIVDMNGFDQTTTHLHAIGSFAGNDRNLIKSAKPCTLTINDTLSGTSSANARIAVQGAITIVHGGTETQEFNSRDINTTGDITINSGKIKLSGTTAIYSVKKITIGENGELVLAGTATTPIPASTILCFDSTGGGIDATDYQGEAVVLSNRVLVDGEYVTNGVYTAENASWLKGSKITVNTDMAASWRSAVDGNWSEASKWTKAPGAGDSVFIDVAGADYAVSVTADNTAMGPLTVGNAAGVATLSVGAEISWPEWASVTLNSGGRICVGNGGTMNYNSYEHASSGNLTLNAGSTLEVSGNGTLKVATQKNSPISQNGGDIIAGGMSKLTIEGDRLPYFGSGKVILKDSAVLETVTGKKANGTALNDLRFYTSSTLPGVTNHIIVQDNARIHPKSDNKHNLDQVIFGYPSAAGAYLFRMDYGSAARSFFGNQIELGGTWGYAEMNVTSGVVYVDGYGFGVGGFYYSGRTATGANVVGVLNVSGGAVDVNAIAYADTKNRVRGLLLGEGWYDKKTASSKNLFTGYVNLSGGVISNRYGAVILGAGAAKGVWTQTGGELVNTSVQEKGPMILGWLGGEGTFILSNGTVNVESDKIATYVGGAETNLTPWVLESQAPSSADASTGLLSLQGGVFTTAGDVVVGQDGDGTIEVGANGLLNARNLELKVAEAADGKPAHSSTLRFKAGAASCGRIALTGTMKTRSDARLEFDLTDWSRSGRLVFLTCSGMEGSAADWSDVAITGLDKSEFVNGGGGRYYFRQDARGIVVAKASGLMIEIR